MPAALCPGAGGKRGKDGKKPVPMKVCTSIIDGLKQIYFQKVGAWAGGANQLIGTNGNTSDEGAQ